MIILVIPSGAIIAAGAYTETATQLQFADQVVPKIVVPGYALVDVAVPEGFTPQRYTYVDGVFDRLPDPPPPEDE